jgi:quercetin dioxygenase-like cupin family protein
VIETVARLQPDARIQQVIRDENLHYMHVRLPASDSLPAHHANGNVYLTVLEGSLRIALEGQPARAYAAGTVLMIPLGTHMDIRNEGPEMLAFTVVKAPAPTA